MNTLTKSVLLLSALLCTTTVSARGHHSKPLSFEELPKICQTYFTRAEACYKKAGKAADFHAGNTKMLRQALPAATPAQREKLCQIAEDSFAGKAKQLKCE
ncbi:hypothetical protein [Neisseria chenwenguii]|uniref:Uncharacterized protein n=1 Tax=Neisseria chenwenguii TaxID=1853278 RepID=A0A220S337_9NEIS|nr:hypothetical protein [Neisseria chenwenguii]ASK27808.1 hypothetical protein BG910_08715 [Neisseria chenwenguii]ROV56550.1 hypothetical protein EGS38_04020 [Neisseria chenwenguii]